MVVKSKCEDFKGTCENPKFPNWAWRFNRNQHMTIYYPWQIREERNYPHYRNMGMHRDFRFHPNDPKVGRHPLIQLGVNLCEELVPDRQAGFGNSALGRTPGPAPPRLMEYSPPAGDFTLDDFYAVNQSHLLSTGMSMHNYQPLLAKKSDEFSQPINPSHYLEKTLGQIVDIPGTFPHFNKALPSTSIRPARLCNVETRTGCGVSTNLMERWRKRQEEQRVRQDRDRCCVQEPGTTYSNMNDWMRLQGRVANSQAPVMYTGVGGFQQLPSVEVSDVETQALKEDYEEQFQRSYSDLAHQIAYRYPNPGLPRIRQGAIGGTWRHVKEVLGHHGSRVCFVDGLVSVYDTDRFSEALQPPLPYKGKLVHPPYAPTQKEHDINNGRKGVTFPKVESDMERKMKLAATPRHKGHYQFK